MTASDLPYRPGVGILLFDRRGLVFAGQRIDTVESAWQMPQGGIDPGEDPESAAMRELEEEIGTSKVELLERTEDWLSYDLPDSLIGKVWGGRYRGQRQVWFAARFLGRDSDIRIETDHPEFSAWRWVALSELPELAIPFKRGIYEKLVSRFGHLAGGETT